MTPNLSVQQGLAMFLLLGAISAAAQIPRSSFPTETDPLPMDDITVREVITERDVLEPQTIRESDIMWEKTVWRVIDTREKLNLPFVYPEAPLFSILADAAKNGDLPVYVEEGGRLVRRMDPMAVQAKMVQTDTIYVTNINTGIDEIKIVENTLNWENVRRFRIKEMWFVDNRTSTLQVRILGIAPLMERYSSNGDYIGEEVLFWVHVPSARPLLARHEVYTPMGNTATTLTWADWLDLRHFSSAVVKEDNVYDRRLQDYLAGEDLLRESDRIQQGIFNREQDMWSR
jgi:gliding motility associated protien GldN